MIDISVMSLEELTVFAKEVRAEMTSREQKAIAEAREEILEIAKKVGLPVSVIVRATTNERNVKAPVAPRYQSKNDPNIKWSGRGRQPSWVKQWVAEGKSLDDLRI